MADQLRPQNVQLAIVVEVGRNYMMLKTCGAAELVGLTVEGAILLPAKKRSCVVLFGEQVNVKSPLKSPGATRMDTFIGKPYRTGR